MADEYITRYDAETAIAETYSPYGEDGSGDAISREDAMSEIRHVPAADVRPVVRGRWIKAKGDWCTPGGDPVWECSECGKGMHVYGVEHGSYGSDVADGQWVACPNCGADMRGMQEVDDDGRAQV